MTKTEKIADRVRKLFALASAEGGGTEAERELALSRAQELMLKYQLDLQDVAPTDDRAVTEQPWEDRSLATGGLEQLLLESIAYACHCRLSYRKGYDAGQGRRWTIYGRPENIEYVRMVFAFVYPQVEAEVAKAVGARNLWAQQARRYVLRTFAAAGGYEHLRDDHDALCREARALGAASTSGELAQSIANTLCLSLNYSKKVAAYVKRGECAPELVDDMGIWRRSFELAASNIIARRLRESQRSFVGEYGDSAKALVVQEDKAVRDYVDALEFGKGSSSKRSTDLGGWRAGADAGQGVALQGGRGLSSHRKQLGA